METIKKYTLKMLAGVLLASALLSPSTLWAAAATETVATNVKADKMVYDSAGQKVTFTGNVVVTHPDYTLTSDRLQLFLSEKSSGTSRAGELDAGVLKRIIAESNVDIKLPEGRTANCSKATYNVANETLTMEGNPVLREGPNQVRGDRMIFYLRENRNEVQGRVTVDFVSGESPPSFNEVGFGSVLGDRP